jgi:transposase
MTNHITFIGIDISKDYLDVHFPQSNKRLRLENSKVGCSLLCKHLARLPCPAVGLEASGGYERLVLRRLTAAGFSTYCLDPAQVRAYSRSRGQRAKTDAIDAEMIALCLKQNHETL